MESIGYKNKQGNFPGLKITMNINKGKRPSPRHKERTQYMKS